MKKWSVLLLILCLLLTGCRSAVRHPESVASTESSSEPQSSVEDPVPSKSSVEESTVPESQEAPAEDSSDVEADPVETPPLDPEASFFAEPLSDTLIQRITGRSYPLGGDPDIPLEDLSYLHLLYVDFQNQTQEGELICHKDISQDLLEIFNELYQAAYQLQNLHLIDDYGAVDELSMQVNNSSCFCYRLVDGEDYLSSHSYGKSVDINPLFNPMVSLFEGEIYINPFAGKEYADRTRDFPHKITHEDLAYQLFTAHGFVWGGDWEGDRKDYMHFEKRD